MLTHFVSKPDSSRDLIISIRSSYSLFGIICIVLHYPKRFFWIRIYVFDEATALNPSGTKALLANGVSTLSIKDKEVVLIV